MTDLDLKVLKALSEVSYGSEWAALNFRGIAQRIGISSEENRRAIRLSCRRLARNGNALYERGLWSEDGDPRGSGYRITDQGRELLLVSETA